MVANAPGSQLYLSWGVSCLMAGTVGLALYRGMYVYMRARARSPLIMLVASLGVLLALTAAITIVFQTAARPLPEAFGNEPWTVGGANIKGFQCIHYRGGAGRLCGPVAGPQVDSVRKGRPGHRRRRRGVKGGGYKHHRDNRICVLHRRRLCGYGRNSDRPRTRPYNQEWASCSF